MAVLNQALAAQQQPQQPQPQQPPEFDPVSALFAEYQRLAPSDTPAKPMFTPEQQNARIDRNNSLTELGLLGSLSGDSGINHVGGQVFKQALGEGAERRTDRGIVDPLTGTESLDPEYVRHDQQTQRGQILQRALAYQQSREASQDRLAAARERADAMREVGAGHDDARLLARTLGGAAGGHNLVQVKDDQTGESFWADPRTGQYVKPVTKGDGTPLVRPSNPTGSDDKELTGVNVGKSAAKMAVDAAMQHPDAFGPVKGLPDQMGDGVVGNVARYYRDNKSLTPDQIAARSIIYNNVSQIIKERAGTAQSKQELKRLQGFLPGEMDNAPAIIAKMKAFDAYLDEKGAAIKGKYAGPRPVQRMNPGGGTAPAPQQGAPAPSGGGLRFNPATGEIEGGE